MIAIKNILVGTDFGEAADSALSYGRELAGRFGATLHVLNVVENFYVTTFGAETYAAFVPEMQRELGDQTGGHDLRISRLRHRRLRP